MRILLVCNNVSLFGGIERVVCNLANAFAEKGCEVVVYSLEPQKYNGFYVYNSVERGINFIWYQGCHRAGFLKFSKPKSLAGKFWREVKRLLVFPVLYYFKSDKSRKFKKVLKKFNPHIVIDNIYTDDAKKLFKYFAKEKVIRVVHTSFDIHTKFNSGLSNFCQIVLLTPQEMGEFKQKYPQANFHIIPNFIPEIPKQNIDYVNKVVLSVGRLCDGKGFFRLIDIWEIVQKDSRFGEWKLHIVGDGLLKEQIQEKIKAKNLQDSIILKPFTNQIEQEYLQASIYVMTSHYEGLPMVLIEAESFGLPCIAFDVKTGPSDIIENEKSGFLIPDGDLEGYAEKLKALMQNQNLRESMGKRAKEIAQEKFSKEVIMKKWFELFERLSIKRGSIRKFRSLY